MLRRSRWWVLAALVGCSSGAMLGDDDGVDDHGPGVVASNAADYAAEVLIVGVAGSTPGNPVPMTAAPQADCRFGGSMTSQLSGSTVTALAFHACDNGYGKILDSTLTFTNDPSGSGQEPHFVVDADMSVGVPDGPLAVRIVGTYQLAANLAGPAVEDLRMTGDRLPLVVTGAPSASTLALTAFDIHVTSFIVLDYGPSTRIDAAYRLDSVRVHDQLGVTTDESLQYGFTAKHPSTGRLTVTGAGASRLEITVHDDGSGDDTSHQVELRVARGSGALGPSIWVSWDELVRRARAQPL